MGGAPSVAGVSPEWGTEGFHVLQTQRGSPGDAAGLEPYFDFIVAINDRRLDKDDDTLRTILKQQCNQTVTLYVYSTKYKRIRSVTVVPSDTWGGPGLLGVSIRFCSFAEAHEAVWHVTNVLPGSPAQAAGLISNSDYIIGSDVTLSASHDLLTLIEVSDKQPIKLYVYNSSTDSTREVTLVPDSSWPGEGSIGCQICSGYLHQIPAPTGDNVDSAIRRVRENERTQKSQTNAPPSVGFDEVFTEIKGEDTHHHDKTQEPTGEHMFDSVKTTASVNIPQPMHVFHPDQDLTSFKLPPALGDHFPSQPAQPQDTGCKVSCDPAALQGTYEVSQQNMTGLTFEKAQISHVGVPQTSSFYPIPQPVPCFVNQQQNSHTTSPITYAQKPATLYQEPASVPCSQNYPSQPPYLPAWTPSPSTKTPAQPTATTSPTGNLASSGLSAKQVTSPSQAFSNPQQATGSNEACPAWMAISIPPNLRQQP